MSRFYQGAGISSASVEWSTPPEVVAALAAEFGPFDLDPCATPGNAKAPAFYTEADDGLTMPWHGRVFMNPPYGSNVTGRWTAKAVAEIAAGNARLVVALVPVRVEVQWWREATAQAALTRILPGRLRFNDFGRAPFASAVLVFGKLPGRHAASHLRCAICDTVMWKKRGAKTCSPRCRKALSRLQESVTA